MLHLITGLPGAGKTLNTIKLINEKPDTKGRPVYYFNIRELKLDWREITKEEALAWYDLPDGSIVVIDECQDLYPPRRIGSEVPKSVQQMSTHRHRGFDIYLITQSPTLIDAAVRKLVGAHYHFERIMGSKRVKAFEWQKVANDPNDYHTKKEADVKQYSLDKKYFELYHSAEVHTHKFKVPFKVYLVLGTLIALGFMAYFIFTRIAAKVEDPETTDVQIGQYAAVEEQGGGFGFSSLSPEPNRPKTVYEYTSAYIPRVQGLDYTAPIYDELTQPKTFPKPNCIVAERTKTCRCYSQQATRMSVPHDMCMRIVRNGWFDFTREENPDNQQQQRGEGGERQARRLPPAAQSRRIIREMNRPVIGLDSAEYASSSYQ